jgi:ATP-dependent helicase/nuclease subunit B
MQNLLNTFSCKVDNGNINFNRLIEPEKLWLQERRSSPISVSDLDLFARCSYKYFIKKVLKLEEEEEAELTLSSLEKGILLHQILYKFYTDLQKEQFTEKGSGIIARSKTKDLPDIFPVVINKSDFLYYKEKLFKIANEFIARNRYDNSLFEVDLKDILGDKDRLGMLERWLSFEVDRDKYRNFCPSLFEFAFGMPKRYTGKSSVGPVDLGKGLKIRGKIDRVEINASNEEEFEFVIADYKLNKSGQIPNDSAIKRKKHFQMPLYLLVMERILKDYYDIEAHKRSAVYYFLNIKKNSGSQGGEDLAEVLFAEKDTGNNAENAKSPLNIREELLNEIVDEAVRILEAISMGAFSEKAGKGSECDNCSFVTICRKDDRL